jgi:hypothetical protein
METKPEINPFIEKLMNGSNEDKKYLDKILEGKPIKIGGRKYKIVKY